MSHHKWIGELVNPTFLLHILPEVLGYRLNLEIIRDRGKIYGEIIGIHGPRTFHKKINPVYASKENKTMEKPWYVAVILGYCVCDIGIRMISSNYKHHNNRCWRIWSLFLSIPAHLTFLPVAASVIDSTTQERWWIVPMVTTGTLPETNSKSPRK